MAYWYQAEPHGRFPALPPVEARLPRFPEEFLKTVEGLPAVVRAMQERRPDLGEERFAQLDALRGELDAALRDNRFASAPGMLQNLRRAIEAGSAL